MPAPRANAKLQRWIDLLAVLLSHHFGITFERIRREVPGYAADPRKSSRANEAAIARMFERDKDELRALGFPVESKQSSDGEDLGYTIDPREVYLPYLTLAASTGRTKPAKVAKQGYRALPELTFEPDELDAVIRATRIASKLGDPLLDQHLESALRKLTFDLPLDAKSDVTRNGDDHAHHASLEQVGAQLRILGEALLRLKRVTFTYHSMGTNSTGSRTIEPYGLFFQSGVWYLAGHDTEKKSLRNFRVSRISGLTMNDHKPQSADYRVPEGFRLMNHARSREAWEIGDGDAEEMVVEFSGDGGAVRAAAALGRPVAGGSGRRSFQVRRLDSFARWLMAFGGGATPVSPPGLVERYDALVAETLAVYAGAAR